MAVEPAHGPPPGGPTPLDALADDLQRLRLEAGSPSYGDVAIAVARLRRARGLSEQQARVARTTVYDVFRSGRRRVDADLVADIVCSLGADEAAAEAWVARCRLAMSGEPAPGPDPATDPVVDPVPDPVPASIPRPGTRAIAVILLASLALNLGGRLVVDWLDVPVYLDMLGTAFAAIVLGPWWGAAVGLSTNVAGATTSGSVSLWFAATNVVGALLWGYGVRRWRLGRTIPRFFLLNLAVALACTAVSAPILVARFGGFVEHGSEGITETVLGITHSLWVSTSVSNLLSSITDKLIAGFVTLTLIEALPARARTWVPPSWLAGDRGGPTP